MYAANYGDSVADVGDAVAMVNRNMANLDQNGLTAATEGALALRDAFEYDVAESTRAAEAIRKNFGSSAEEAFSLIAAGAQNGLDYSGELIDTINEYSSQFAKLGFDADGMFNILQAGADGTAWNLDKVGDAIKEFSIRAIDGSDSTVEAFTSLGYNAENIMATFAAGGEGANKAFFDVINTLMAVDDQVERDALGVALFGTMWEDLGTEAMEAMAGRVPGPPTIPRAPWRRSTRSSTTTWTARSRGSAARWRWPCCRRRTPCINPLWTVCRRSRRPWRRCPQ